MEAPDPWAKAYGEKGSDEFATPWADIEIGGVVQRMRWIEPGSFLMGCDPGDPGGDGNEKPQHRVTLTKGFWLADTACTQGLWQAVTGQNPSDFKGSADLPVENVSWDDVTGLFLPKVAQRLGAKAELPTEAEWEFACRAGTQSAYEFGNAFNPTRVNVSNEVRKTVPVRRFPPNRWGLYQMQGNVWEWCADARRTYTERAVTDPEGGQVGSVRAALRGGSWHSGGSSSRCASRGVCLRVIRHDDIGFRFALRSVEPCK